MVLRFLVENLGWKDDFFLELQVLKSLASSRRSAICSWSGILPNILPVARSTFWKRSIQKAPASPRVSNLDWAASTMLLAC